MGYSTTPTTDTIRQATTRLNACADAFRTRFETARDLLLSGDWTQQLRRRS